MLLGCTLPWNYGNTGTKTNKKMNTQKTGKKIKHAKNETGKQ